MFEVNGGVFTNCKGLTGTIEFYTPNTKSNLFQLFYGCANIETVILDVRNCGDGIATKSDVTIPGSG